MVGGLPIYNPFHLKWQTKIRCKDGKIFYTKQANMAVFFLFVRIYFIYLQYKKFLIDKLII